MPTLKHKKGEIKVAQSLVVRMADRIGKLGPGYAARAQERVKAAQQPHKNDVATVLAARGMGLELKKPVTE